MQIQRQQQKRVQRSKNKGFTLVEALVTIAIIGIVSAFVFPSFSNVSNDQKNKADTERIEQFADQIGIICSYQDAFEELTNLADPNTYQLQLQFPIKEESGKWKLDVLQGKAVAGSTLLQTLTPKTYAYLSDLSSDEIKFDSEDYHKGSVLVTIQFNATNSEFAQEQGRKPEIAKDLTEVTASFLN